MNTASALLEEISTQIVLGNPDSPEEIESIIVLLGKLEACARGEGQEELAALAVDCRNKLILQVENDQRSGRSGGLEWVSKAVMAMQSLAITTKPGARVEGVTALHEEEGDNGVTLPEWVDEKTFSDFLIAQKYAIDEIETNILELEKGHPETLIALRRRVHTAKGEAGAVGQEQIEYVLHVMEDMLEALPQTPTPRWIDYLLCLKDWLSSALDRLRERKGPQEKARDVLARAASIITTNSGALRQKAAGRQFQRDQATRQLIAEFLNDAAEDVAQADQLLLTVEQGGPNAEAIHHLFRIFHTHKGVAGFLSFGDIVKLAHATESLLNLAREGSAKLEGEYLEVTFLATDWFRRLLDVVRQCLERGTEVESVPDLAPFISRLEQLARVETTAERDPARSSGRSASGTSTDKPIEQVSGSGREPVLVANGLDVVPIRETVKVDLAHVDNLVELIGELMIIESMVLNAPEVSAVSSLRFKGHVNQLMKISRDLQRSGMQLRMVPVRGLFQKMSRLVRDLSRKSGKDVRLRISGEGTEMDRSMVEQLADPLIHLIRNSVDHGVEFPAERKSQNKPSQGTIYLEARHEGGSIAIEIRDDGRGLDRTAIRDKALRQGLIAASEQLSDQEIESLLFLPGFSTAKQVSELSGRGVGLDVVKKNVESMRGRVLLTSTPGQGTSFKLVLPLTLAIIDGMLIGCGPEKYIVPTLSIVESIKPSREMVRSVAGRREFIDIRGEFFALCRLGELFQVPGAHWDPTEGIVIVIESFGRKVALLVDEIITQQQVVIKGAGDHISTGDYFSGATILADGRVGLILNVHELCNQRTRQDREHRDKPGIMQRTNEKTPR